MQTDLLSTKLFFPPPRPSLVARPRLVERLQTGLRGPLTLISAPAGSGKTTLLSEWRAGYGAGMPVAWVSLEAADNELSRFFQYLSAALDLIQPGIAAETSPLLHHFEQLNTEAFLTLLVNRLTQLQQGFVLVLDVYHLIESQAIHSALIFLLEHLPPRMHLVLLTRSDPPLPIARLRARGQLNELRVADLRFSVEEAATFLNQAMGLDLTAEQVAALEKRTEGWIAGLQLAAISMQGRDDLDGFISAFTGSNRYIVDYLAEEVLDRQPETVRQFLLKTSILERLTGSLCDALTGSDDGQITLEQLAQSNLFMIPLDDEHRWYRYHHLFTDLLLHRLQTIQPESIPQLHRQAASWLEANHMIDDAISHALAAKDYAMATRLFSTDQVRVIYDRDLATLSRWLRAFPEEIVRADPRMSIAQAHILWSTGQRQQVESYANSAQQALITLADSGQMATQEPTYVNLWGETLALQSLAAVIRGDTETAHRLSGQAVEMLPRYSLARGFALGGLYSSYRQMGNIDKAIDICIETIEVTRAINYPSMYTTSVYTLGQNLFVKGQLHRAARAYRDCLEYGERQGKIFYYGIDHIGLAEILHEWNELDQTETHIKDGLALIRKGGTSILLPAAIPIAASLACARQGPGYALEVLDQLWGECQGMDASVYENIYVMLRIQYLAKMGEQNETAAWLDQINWDEPVRPTPGTGFRFMLAARILLMLDQVDQALRVLKEMETYTQESGYSGWLIATLGLMALAWQQKKDNGRALEYLEKGLALAEPEGYIRTFVDLGEPMQALLRNSQKRGLAPGYVSRLLVAFGSTTSMSSQLNQSLISPLSKRELELLALIATGSSNKEIASQLYISIGTVKRHTVNIFNKLDVKNRTEAVAKARELGLL